MHAIIPPDSSAKEADRLRWLACAAYALASTDRHTWADEISSPAGERLATLVLKEAIALDIQAVKPAQAIRDRPRDHDAAKLEWTAIGDEANRRQAKRVWSVPMQLVEMVNQQQLNCQPKSRDVERKLVAMGSELRKAGAEFQARLDTMHEAYRSKWRAAEV